MCDSIEVVSAWVLLAADDAAQPFNCMQLLPFFIGMALLAYFFLFLPERRDRQRKEQLRKDLKKNDRVVTIGGVLGTVASVSPDNNEVILKIDEATGAKMRVLRSAIHEVIRDEKKDDKKDAKPEEPKKAETKEDCVPK